MSNISPSCIRPLLKQGSTPLKCLGLSRKRKRSSLTKTSSVIDGVMQCSPVRSVIEESGCLEVEKLDVESAEYDQCALRKSDSTKTLNIKKKKTDEVSSELTKTDCTIVEEESKTQSLECDLIQINKIKKLENVYYQWANGCKNALLYLLNILKERNGENVNVKKLLQELGIHKTMLIHFQNDSDLDLAAYESDSDT